MGELRLASLSQEPLEEDDDDHVPFRMHEGKGPHRALHGNFRIKHEFCVFQFPERNHFEVVPSENAS